MTDRPEMEFFNGLSGTLTIELTEPTESIGTLENQRATPTAVIRSLKLVAEVFEEDKEEFRSITKAEFDSVAYRGARILLRGLSGQSIEHKAPNGKWFTVQDLLSAVEETERRTRGQSEWSGGVDVHHCFFEGIQPSSDGVWKIYWGS